MNSCTALQNIYAMLNGAQWVSSTGFSSQMSLADPATCCKAFGVMCDANSDVIGLYLPNNNLKGNLPSTLFKDFFPKLTVLSVQNNGLQGVFPPLGNLNIRHIDISNNSFSGPVPSVVNQPGNVVYFNCNLGLNPWTCMQNGVTDPACNIGDKTVQPCTPAVAPAPAIVPAAAAPGNDLKAVQSDLFTTTANAWKSGEKAAVNDPQFQTSNASSGAPIAAIVGIIAGCVLLIVGGVITVKRYRTKQSPKTLESGELAIPEKKTDLATSSTRRFKTDSAFKGMPSNKHSDGPAFVSSLLTKGKSSSTVPVVAVETRESSFEDNAAVGNNSKPTWLKSLFKETQEAKVQQTELKNVRNMFSHQARVGAVELAVGGSNDNENDELDIDASERKTAALKTRKGKRVPAVVHKRGQSLNHDK